MKNSYEDYLQATTNFLKLLESTTKIEIKNKKDYSRAFNLWCYMGKPKSIVLRDVFKKKASPAGILDVKQGKSKYCTDRKPAQRIDRDKFPIKWEDLLK